jgi:oligopeptide transport system substrate-binding protein
MAIMEQKRNGRIVRKHRSLVARLSVVALAVLITGVGVTARGSGSASASANAAGGYKLAPAMMGGGASQPGAAPNATLTLNLSGGNEVTTVDPQVESFVNEIEVSSLVFAPLLALNQHNQVAANAATSMNVSPNGLTYTFTIRPGMTYTDGQPVTAQDYAFAIKRACDPVVNGNYSNILFDVVGCEAWRTADLSKTSKSKLREMEQTVTNAIKALDAHTLRIQLLKPAGYFPFVMATWVTYPARPDLVKAGGANWWKNPKYYIGNGPFKVVSWKPRQQWVLARNDSYFRGRPGLARLIWKEVSSPETALLAYKQGQFDNITLDATLLPQVLGDPTLKQQLHRQVAATTFYIGFDNADKPFNNVKVRQAFAYALNRQQYINQVANGAGKPAGTFLYPGIAGYQTKFQQTYNPAKAKSLLAQAGYPNGQGFPTLQLRYNNTSAAAKERATFWSQQLKQILNVNIQPTPTDPAQLQKLLAARSPQLKIYILGWVQDYPHPQDWLTLVFGNNSSLAPHGWNDPHFNALVNQADKLPIEEATPLYQQADAYLARMAPVAFYLYAEDLELVKPDVKGYVRYPTAAFDTTWQPEKIYKTKP